MARVLILYGTTDGHTRKIAVTMADTFSAEGWHSSVVDARHAHGINAADFDRVVVAASIHAGGYQAAVKGWVRRNRAALNHMRTAFVSVCLGILEQRPEAQREVRAIPERFYARIGWRPATTKIVAGAVPYTRYGWLKKLVMKRMVARAGGDTDTSRDFEYTDWDDLRSFTHDFASREGSFTPSSPSSSWGVARL